MAGSGTKKPLSTFENVMARSFPLPADLDTLQQFVDDYLNAPCFGGGHYFRAAVPLVFLQLLDYGSMSGRLTGEAHTSQNELLLMIVLEWFEESHSGTFRFNNKNYKRHSESHALVTPFIFVDNPISVMMGRENFGWPKSLISVMSSAPGWAPEPGDTASVIKVGGMRLAQFYEGKDQRFSTILEIERQWGYSDGTTGVLLNPGDALANWWSGTKQNLDVLTRQWREIVGLNIGGSGMATDMLERYRQTVLGNAFGPGSIAHWFASFGNSIGVKHFSDPENDDEPCFEALANMRTEVTKIYGGGLLGTLESQMSRLDGGFTIRVHRYEAYPAVEMLGLKVTRVEKAARAGDPEVDVLTPLMPFWYRTDFKLKDSVPLSTRIHGEDLPGTLELGQLGDYIPEFSISMGQKLPGEV